VLLVREAKTSSLSVVKTRKAGSKIEFFYISVELLCFSPFCTPLFPLQTPHHSVYTNFRSDISVIILYGEKDLGWFIRQKALKNNITQRRNMVVSIRLQECTCISSYIYASKLFMARCLVCLEPRLNICI